MSPNFRGTATAVRVSEPIAPEPAREFAFSDADSRSLAQFAYEQAGIALADSKRNLVYSRLSRRLRVLKLSSFRQYREYLAANASELESFINAISTNLTKFFREAHHFDHFRTHVAVPFVQASHGKSGRRLRVWSAGCSTGEEPYTIAVVLKREMPDIDRHDVRILATDIDTEVIAKGARGEYAMNAIDEVPKTYKEFFQPSGEKNESANVCIGADIQKLVATHYNVSRADILSSRRSAGVVKPRQIAMYLSKQLTLRSLPEIGRRFGGRDHTTVLHAVRKIEGCVQADPGLREDVELLKRMLQE